MSFQSNNRSITNYNHYRFSHPYGKKNISNCSMLNYPKVNNKHKSLLIKINLLKEIYSIFNLYYKQYMLNIVDRNKRVLGVYYHR